MSERARSNSPVSSIQSFHYSIRSDYHNTNAVDHVNGDNHADTAYKPVVSADVEETYSQDPKAKRSLWALISDWFVLEALAILISLLLLLAIIVVLSHFDGQPQPSWNHMSLNSMISWLSTFSKACVLFAIGEALGQLKWVWFSQKTRSVPNLRTFDAASRGPFGSAGLIWNLRARHFAVLGCLATILAFGVDPFTQNLIMYYNVLTADVSEVANVSSSFVYDVTGLTIRDGLPPYVDPSLKANVYNSLLNDDSTRPWSLPHYTCSTGNCTWGAIAALELSASCTNVTNHLKFSCGEVDDFYYVPNCTVSLPNSNTSSNFMSGRSEGFPVTVALVDPENAEIYTTPWHWVTQFIAPEGLVMGAPFKANPTQWQAMECALIPTVRSFTAEVRRGVYKEKTLATWTNGTYEIDPSPGYFIRPPWGPEMGMERNQTFEIGPLPMQAMGKFFEDIFTGHAWTNARFGIQFSSPGGTYAGADIIQAIAYSDMTGCTVRTAERLECIMKNVAEAVSKSFRDSADIASGAGTHMVVGQAKTIVTYIAVFWQWMALPALVWLLGLATVIGTAWKSQRADIPKWKNDMIPLLFLYPDGQQHGVPRNEEEEDRLNLRLYRSDDKMVLGGSPS
ncbi:hypothetical protein N7457_000201 [Penicillium paradoxum]|uniref:uncharacterized protein n=1 Tax=Penicillium paradoxum TaxID=176176 RepID=UPI0025487F5D|nr:uncharacterized protein N7457_000201 [Penicillium paradoxum]KAJ5793602.1 hypothetical protein N7457_000201 [Penicillium paradoxum]